MTIINDKKFEIKKSTADANIEFDFDKNTVPVRAISQKCAIGITVSKIRFSGNVAAWIASKERYSDSLFSFD